MSASAGGSASAAACLAAAAMAGGTSGAASAAGDAAPGSASARPEARASSGLCACGRLAAKKTEADAWSRPARVQPIPEGCDQGAADDKRKAAAAVGSLIITTRPLWSNSRG